MNEKTTPYLSPLGVFSLSFGYAVGWGAFIMPGTVFLPGSGPLGTLIGILLGSLAMSVFALNYHRMILREPGPGGAFGFARKVFGEDSGFLVGWFLFLAYIAILWANSTAVILLGRFLFGGLFQFGFHYNVAGFEVYFGEGLLSVCFIVAAALVCLLGRKPAARTQIAMAVAFAGIVIISFAIALARHSGGWQSMAPAFAPDKGNALVQVLRVLAMMPWAFVGFEAVAHSSSEFAFCPKKTMKILLVSIGVSALVYLLLALLPVISVHESYADWFAYVRDLHSQSGIDAVPVFTAARRAMGQAGVAATGVAMIAAQFTGLVGAFIAMSRLLYSMSESGVLPEWLGRTDKSGSSRNAMIFICAISCIIPFFGRTAISWPVDVSSLGAAIAFGYTSACAFKVHNMEDAASKLFCARTAGIAGVVMSVCFCILLLVPNYLSGSTLAAESYLLLAGWCILGFVYYRFIFHNDTGRRFGKSVVVWMSLIVMIIFSSLMWVRQSTLDSVDGILESSVRDPDRIAHKAARMEHLNWTLLEKSLIEMGLLVSSLIVMASLFAMLRKREQISTLEKIKAEELNRTKSYFFSTVSHDIRTPLNAIIGFSEMLKAGFDTDAERDQAVESILVSGKMLLNLINDVLDLSKLESGRMTIEPEPVDCKRLVNEIVETFKMSRKTPNVTVRGKVEDMPPLMIDPQRMRQIAFNMAGNAVKFTKEGFVEIRASFKNGVFILEVADSGCGISEEDLKKIATPYVQVGSKASRHGGTGLGLAITRQLAKAMGGDLAVTSTLGEGSVFSVKIPDVKVAEKLPEGEHILAHAHHEAAVKEHSAVFGRLLIADDQKMKLLVLSAMLKKIGSFEITTASNGKEALDILLAAGPGSFDMVMTDMWMPEMDGTALVKAIRADPNLASLPVYVLTADVETQEVYAELGFTGMILKPITLEKLKGIF